MKKLTKAQAKAIAKELAPFMNNYLAQWEEEEKITIKGISEELYKDTQGVYNFLCEAAIDCMERQQKDLQKEADYILDMIRYPEYVAGPLATIRL